MKNSMHTNLSGRYVHGIHLDVTKIMDPMFKVLPFVLDEDHLNVVGSVEAEAVMLAINNSTPNELELSTSLKIELLKEPDLPLSKKCKVSKAEKQLLCFVDDITSSAEKAGAEVRNVHR